LSLTIGYHGVVLVYYVLLYRCSDVKLYYGNDKNVNPDEYVTIYSALKTSEVCLSVCVFVSTCVCVCVSVCTCVVCACVCVCRIFTQGKLGSDRIG